MQNRTIRTTLLVVFALTIMLLAFHYFYEDTVFGSPGIDGHSIIDGLVVVLMASLLYAFYRYTIHTDYLANQLFERKSTLAQYLDVLPEGIAVIDASQQISYINQAGKTLLNLSFSPTNVHLLSDWTARFCQSCLGDVNQPLPIATLTIDNHKTPNGTTRTLTVQTRPLYDEQGKLLETISLLRDTSEYRCKEEELKRAYTMAEQALAEREIFLANISHDTRTPLNAILGFSELLAHRKTEPDDHTYLEGIRTSGNKLLALINELLDLSRIESGQLTLEPKPVLLDEILQDVAAEIMPKARHKNIQYEVRVDLNAPALFLADRLRIVQVIVNIGLNSVNFTDEGFIRLSVQHSPSDQLQRTQLVLTIDDSGAGIAIDKLDKIFDRFSRVSDQAIYRSGGTGLGLNIAHSLVTLMGGTIDVQSRPGHGTTFCIRLPVELPDVNAPVLMQTALIRKPQFIPSSMRVLIVEDNILNQKVMEGYLKRHQVMPTIVNNGFEAVEILKNMSFDLIFMDIQMPIMDGYLATETIRKQLALNTPIIAMTAYTMAGEQERCLSTGMNDYLSKPIRINQLDNVLARFMPDPASKNQPTTPANTVAMGTNIIDESFLNELMDGDDELLAEMVSLFQEDLPNYRQTLFNAIDQQDQSLFKQTAHKFRSSLNSLAMLETAKGLKLLETDVALDPLAKRAQLASLFEDINQGMKFFDSRLA
jgi:signal transduction histidine kinase/CheY-like chemotaxis protein